MEGKQTAFATSQDYMVKYDDKEALVEVTKPTDKRKERFERIAQQLAAKGSR